MSFLVDTNILSAHLRRPRGLTHRFTQHSGRLYTSTINLAELYGWAFRVVDSGPRVDAIDRLLRYEVTLLEYEINSARTFGQLKVELTAHGITVSPLDLLIASAAITFGLTLVTNNVRHFEKIPGLRIENWLTE